MKQEHKHWRADGIKPWKGGRRVFVCSEEETEWNGNAWGPNCTYVMSFFGMGIRGGETEKRHIHTQRSYKHASLMSPPPPPLSYMLHCLVDAGVRDLMIQSGHKISWAEECLSGHCDTLHCNSESDILLRSDVLPNSVVCIKQD